MAVSRADGMRKVSITDLHKRYSVKGGATVALSDVNLTISRGEFVSLLGPWGCGKSTLLRIMSALIPPTSGTVTVDDAPMMAPSRDIGIVFRQPVLLPWRTVLDNVLLPTEILRLDMKAARDQAHGLLRMVGLEGFETRSPGELSGGMQQRAASCCALLHNPSMLLMNEPFAALDAMTREELCLDLLKIWEIARKAIVFVTHNIPEAILLSDRVVAMSPRPGRTSWIIDIDLPRPRTLDMEFTAAFKDCSDTIRSCIGH